MKGNNPFKPETVKVAVGVPGRRPRRRKAWWSEVDEDHGSISWSRQVGDPKVDITAEFNATNQAKPKA